MRFLGLPADGQADVIGRRGELVAGQGDLVAKNYVVDRRQIRRQLEVAHSPWGFVKPILLLLLACSLLMLQPDFGTTVVLLMTAFGMLFLGGAPLWQFALLVVLAIGSLLALVWVSPYRLERVTSFLNPWEHARQGGHGLGQHVGRLGRPLYRALRLGDR